MKSRNTPQRNPTVGPRTDGRTDGQTGAATTPALMHVYSRERSGRLADALTLSDTSDKVHLSEEGETTIYLCRYSKDVHRTKCQALTIVRLTHSPYTTKIARKMLHSLVL